MAWHGAQRAPCLHIVTVLFLFFYVQLTHLFSLEEHKLIWIWVSNNWNTLNNGQGCVKYRVSKHTMWTRYFSSYCDLLLSLWKFNSHPNWQGLSNSVRCLMYKHSLICFQITWTVPIIYFFSLCLLPCALALSRTCFIFFFAVTKAPAVRLRWCPVTSSHVVLLLGN